MLKGHENPERRNDEIHRNFKFSGKKLTCKNWQGLLVLSWRSYSVNLVKAEETEGKSGKGRDQKNLFGKKKLEQMREELTGISMDNLIWVVSFRNESAFSCKVQSLI